MRNLRSWTVVAAFVIAWPLAILLLGDPFSSEPQRLELQPVSGKLPQAELPVVFELRRRPTGEAFHPNALRGFSWVAHFYASSCLTSKTQVRWARLAQLGGRLKRPGFWGIISIDLTAVELAAGQEQEKEEQRFHPEDVSRLVLEGNESQLRAVRRSFRLHQGDLKCRAFESEPSLIFLVDADGMAHFLSNEMDAF